jgi:hypothetical protein
MIYIPNVGLKSCQNDFIYQTGGSIFYESLTAVPMGIYVSFYLH